MRLVENTRPDGSFDYQRLDKPTVIRRQTNNAVAGSLKRPITTSSSPRAEGADVDRWFRFGLFGYSGLFATSGLMTVACRFT